MSAFYNENEPSAAAWLRELVTAGAITPGVVDGRCVREIRGVDLRSRTRAHFFAGIGGWDLALRLAGWPADRPVWTASLPCQPFSQAGLQRGTDDERHLWPTFHGLVAECRPPIIFGEQVASKAGRVWLASVRLDLEALGYAVGATDLCAAGAGAPHIRQRLYWLGHDERARSQGYFEPSHRPAEGKHFGRTGTDDRLAHPDRERPGEAGRAEEGGRIGGSGTFGGLGHAQRSKPRRNPGTGARAQEEASLRSISHSAESSGSINSPWSDVVYIRCLDDKYRPIPRVETESALLAQFLDGIPNDLGDMRAAIRYAGLCQPLAEKIPGRIQILRGAGNAIVPELAAIFIASVMDVLDSR